MVRTKLRRMRRHKVSGKKAKVLKMSTELRDEWRRNKRPNLVLELGDSCCSDHFNAMAASSLSMANANDRFLVMGQKRNGQLLPTLILPWSKKSKVNFLLHRQFFFARPRLEPYACFSSPGHSQCCQSLQEDQLFQFESRLRRRGRLRADD